MKVIIISVLSLLALVAAAAAQGTPSSKSASPSATSQASGAASQAQLSEIRSLTYRLQAHTEKLDELMTQYHSLVDQRPQAQGGSAEAKRAHEQQLANWDTALERLLHRIDGARAAVAESMQHLELLATGKLPTTLAKDVARARNDAVAQRTAAEQVLVKNKSTLARAPKPTRPADSAPSLPDDL